MRPVFLLPILILLLAGCAPKTTVVLLPDEKGEVGVVEVQAKKAIQVIDTANAYTEVWLLDTPSAVKIMPMSAISHDFSLALAAEPPPPESYYLYFHSEKTVLDRQSQSKFPSIIQSIQGKNQVEINVIGHTDSAGVESYNWALSRRRAESIRDKLVRAGIDPEVIFISFHGENEPLIPTPDGAHEPRNRRVEIFLR